MMATKVDGLKCRVIQVDRSGLDINLQEVKFIPKIFVTLPSINKPLKNEYDLRYKVF
jgi:hypothetical protein